MAKIARIKGSREKNFASCRPRNVQINAAHPPGVVGMMAVSYEGQAGRQAGGEMGF